MNRYMLQAWGIGFGLVLSNIILFNPYCGRYPLYQLDCFQFQITENPDATDLNNKEIISCNKEVQSEDVLRLINSVVQLCLLGLMLLLYFCLYSWCIFLSLLRSSHGCKMAAIVLEVIYRRHRSNRRRRIYSFMHLSFSSKSFPENFNRLPLTQHWLELNHIPKPNQSLPKGMGPPYLTQKNHESSAFWGQG